MFEGLDGVAVYHLTREPIPLINHAVKEMMFRFMRVEWFANNFTSITSRVVWTVNREIFTAVHIINAFDYLKNLY